LPERGTTFTRLASLLAALPTFIFPDVAAADEAGSSFWLPGTYASFAASLSQPGWSYESTFYHATAAANGDTSFARGGGIHTGLKSPSDYVMWTPTYTFATPVLGGQAAVSLTALWGRNTTSVESTRTERGDAERSGSRSDYVLGSGDVYPSASLKWNWDVHSVMLYATAGMPVGVYGPNRLASMGLGHWATDAGAGYTYYKEKAYNEKAGFEWSVVVGLTYNFINPYTQYQSGIDVHVDWAVSPYVSDKMHFGVAGYFYNQLTGDGGPGATLGEHKSRVVGIGPQIGFFFPFMEQQGTLTVRAYQEFDAGNRLEGWTTFITLSVERPEQKSRTPVKRQ
jgi:hypothetical protein